MNYKLKNVFGDIEPHEVFLDKLAHSREEELGLSEKKFEVPLKEKMSYFLFGIFLVISLVFLSKTFYFQVVEGEKLAVMANNNKGGKSIIIPPRGIIYDKNMKKLVLNSPAYDLVCDRIQFSFPSEEIPEEIKNIADATGLDAQDLSEKIKNNSSSQVLILENLPHAELLVLETKINQLEGCKIQQNTSRQYVYGPVFSQILGYTGRINKEEYADSAGYSINDHIGKMGLEKYYESYLRGDPGEMQVLRSALGAESGNKVLTEPQPGNNLILNIDSDFQKEVYNALEKSIKNVGAERGAAIAMDPRTGAVLALVSYPSYDDNAFSNGISSADYNQLINDPNKPFLNRVIQARYPTGSTIKPLEASAALQEKLISPDKEINDPGYILVHSQYDPSVSYKYSGVTPHGMVDMRRAIAVSSNIYFYTIGGGYGDQKGLGPERIKKYLSLFGWDEKTGIDLPGEFSGFIPDPAWKKKTKNQSWWDGDTYNLAIGQSDLQTTPLQVASAYCAIANGGTLYKPQIVKKVISGSGDSAEVLHEFQPQVIRSGFIDAENLEIIKEGMRDAVYQEYGLAGSLKSLPVTVAVKTGTAEIGYANHFNVWSSAFAPYENPEIVLVVTVENVQGFGAVTLPVARDALQWYFSRNQ